MRAVSVGDNKGSNTTVLDPAGDTDGRRGGGRSQEGGGSHCLQVSSHILSHMHLLPLVFVIHVVTRECHICSHTCMSYMFSHIQNTYNELTL